MRNHTSLYHAPAALLWMEKNWNYKINRATLNIFILNNRLTTTKHAFVFVTLLMHFICFLYLYLFKCNWSVITQVPHMHKYNISSINQTKMQSTKHTSYTAQFTRSTVRSACSAENKHLLRMWRVIFYMYF